MRVREVLYGFFVTAGLLGCANLSAKLNETWNSTGPSAAETKRAGPQSVLSEPDGYDFVDVDDLFFKPETLKGRRTKFCADVHGQMRFMASSGICNGCSKARRDLVAGLMNDGALPARYHVLLKSSRVVRSPGGYDLLISVPATEEDAMNKALDMFSGMDRVCFWADGDLSTLPDPVSYDRSQDITLMHISASRWQDNHWFEAELAKRRQPEPRPEAVGGALPAEQASEEPPTTEEDPQAPSEGE